MNCLIYNSRVYEYMLVANRTIEFDEKFLNEWKCAYVYKAKFNPLIAIFIEEREDKRERERERKIVGVKNW